MGSSGHAMTDAGGRPVPKELRDRPRYRGSLHAFTVFAAVPACTALVLMADRAAARVSAVIYAASVLALFGTSASYHRLAQSERARRIMRRIDHSMIFVLIAGTYTPVCLLALPKAWGITVLTLVWTCALFGIVLKVAAFQRMKVLHYALYPILGWGAVVALPLLFDRLTTPEFSFLVAGGLIYTLGIPVLVWERPNPWPKVFGYHEIWHVFTVVAAACHFVLVGLLIDGA
jgi:hemolysin III